MTVMPGYFDVEPTDDERRERLAALLYVRSTIDDASLQEKLDVAIRRICRELGRCAP